MKYYVVTDTHAFFTPMKKALEEAGYFTDKEPHKLIMLGDLMDRGKETLLMQEFVYDLLEKDEVILIRGNHEDYLQRMLDRWLRGDYYNPIHHHNGTVQTAVALGNFTMIRDFDMDPRGTRNVIEQSVFVSKIMPAMLDYYETEHYIFTHGWIPCYATDIDKHNTRYEYMENWREADAEAWKNARWFNGQEAAHWGATEPGKTIVCGHIRCSYGHFRYEGSSKEDFSPYYGNGVIALDANTAKSGKVNCILLED